MAKYFPLAALAILVISADSDSETDQYKTLDLLKGIDKEINELTLSIREGQVGWGSEILTSRQTSDFERRYLRLKNRLDPVMTSWMQGVRERAAGLRTMGEALSSIPALVSDMLTIVDYETRLNHVEFLITTRRATISNRLSMMIALVLGVLGVLLGIASVWRKASVEPRLREIDQQHKQIVAMVERCQKVLSRRSWLHARKRRCSPK
jgi:hypothetical protein